MRTVHKLIINMEKELKVFWQDDGSFRISYELPDTGQTYYSLPEGFNIETDTPILKDDVVFKATESEVQEITDNINSKQQTFLEEQNTVSNLVIAEHSAVTETTIPGILAIPFNTLGYESEVPEYSAGGRKVSHRFVDGDRKVVERIFSDRKEDGTGKFLGVDIQFNYFDNSETQQITASKTWFKPFSPMEAANHLQGRRRRRYQLLEQDAEDLGIKPLAVALLLKFNNEKLIHIEANDDTLIKDKILTEKETGELKDQLNEPSPNPKHMGLPIWKVIILAIEANE